MKIHETAFIHPQATAIGLVEMGPYSSLWPGAVVRADMNRIVLGEGVNIQDNSTLHTDSSRGITVGEYTLVGHNSMLHGCTIGRGCLIGIGSVVLDEAEIGDGAMIMAGCMIRGGKKIPSGAMVIQKNGELKIFEGKAKPVMSVAGCLEYIALAERFKKGIFGPFSAEEETEFQNRAKVLLEKMGIPFKA
ncbi:gamma carbonic anhydrase family protein [Leptospira ellisii]|uniref:Gamma carbonic anhydrase family protein n=1 Tax=Leptospira ellisii TaxID=2023197 RepID=A0A2N0B7J3_9LEPT|nr:gamma carbonic anhydrase family protein [Leptospira ellisii]MDV6234251.1 gamma carbonic anhydrase family protein [Leptospira ellisii]PJZ92500.1 gamma carbonic anhydrase family protein [Leptospira ellisii]PKA02579.1 gamma carbonic anhydrase family protein [Leptospira ellisii]